MRSLLEPELLAGKKHLEQHLESNYGEHRVASPPVDCAGFLLVLLCTGPWRISVMCQRTGLRPRTVFPVVTDI